MKGIATIIILLILVFSISYIHTYGKPDFFIKENQSIESSNEETHTCEECGSQFIGYGYYEESKGVWVTPKVPYQSYICSKACGLKHARIAEQSEAESENSASNQTGYSTGRDGRLYENAPCGLCNGTGIEKAVNSMGKDRICPMCEGRGHQSY